MIRLARAKVATDLPFWSGMAARMSGTTLAAQGGEHKQAWEVAGDDLSSTPGPTLRNLFSLAKKALPQGVSSICVYKKLRSAKIPFFLLVEL